MTLRLATFNLENLDDAPNSDPPFKTRAAILRPQLQRMRADVLCLQEVNARRTAGSPDRQLTALSRLIKGTAYEDYDLAHSFGPDNAHPGDKHNLVILSRLPIIRHRSVRHDFVDPPLHRLIMTTPASDKPAPVPWQRPLQCAAIDVGAGRTLHVLNLHLRAPIAAWLPGEKTGPFSWRSVSSWAEGYYLSAMQRTGQALEARLLVDKLFDADPHALIAVCGDLNARLRETPTRMICGAEEDTGNGLLATRALVALERSLPQDRAYSVIHHGQPEMLDHILVSHTLFGSYRDIEVHNESLADELVGYAEVRHDPASYHAPVVAEFTL